MDEKRLEGEIASLKAAIIELSKRIDEDEEVLNDVAQGEKELADILGRMVEVITNE